MDRRDFFKSSTCGIGSMMLAYFGLSNPLQAEEKELQQEEYILQLLVKQMGKSKEEAKKMIEDFKKKLPMVKEMCICKGCPSYIKEEPVIGFCHPLIGKSKVIKKEKGCICGSCPVYKKMKMKFGYYCTRGAELELKIQAEKKG